MVVILGFFILVGVAILVNKLVVLMDNWEVRGTHNPDVREHVEQMMGKELDGE